MAGSRSRASRAVAQERRTHPLQVVHADEEQARLRGNAKLAQRIAVGIQRALYIEPGPLGDETGGQHHRADVCGRQIQLARGRFRLPVQVDLFGNVAGIVGARFGPRGVVRAGQRIEIGILGPSGLDRGAELRADIGKAGGVSTEFLQPAQQPDACAVHRQQADRAAPPAASLARDQRKLRSAGPAQRIRFSGQYGTASLTCWWMRPAMSHQVIESLPRSRRVCE